MHGVMTVVLEIRFVYAASPLWGLCASKAKESEL